MGAAKTSMIVLVLLGYGIYIGGVVLENFPIEALLASPPIVQLVVPTVIAIAALLLIEWFAP